MKIKKRLIINNTVAVVIPLIITIIAAFVVIFVYSNFFKRDTGYDSFKNLIRLKTELFRESGKIASQNPDIVQRSDFQQYLSQKVLSLNGKVIITKGPSILFSSEGMNKIDVEKCAEEVNSPAINDTVEINNIPYIYQATALKFSDGASGYVILLAPIERDNGFVTKFIAAIIVIFIISFIIVNIIISYIFSKSILRPVSQLKAAAAEISSGNLDCEIVEAGDEEINELCRDFEIMRIQLKDSVRMKMKYDDNRKMLVSSISHDLKTPITSIKGYVEGILDGIADNPEKIESYLKTIYSKAGYIDGMIDDLLLYSRLELNQIPFNFEKTDMIQYFNDCIYENTEELQKANIRICLKNDLTQAKYVMIDRGRMRRVVMNILDNCRKYMDKSQGEITINLRETNSSIIAEVRDNGAGIGKDDINKIFDRFYRADAARSGIKGSGLGLAIAKQIVEGHGGKIWGVGHENEGTSILISLAKITGE